MRLLRLIGSILARPTVPWPVPPPTPPPPPPPAEDAPATLAEVLRLVNQLRLARGLAPLRPSMALADASADHAGDMHRRGYFDHVSPEGRTSGDRARAAGNAGPVREVIAWNYPDASAVVAGWMASTGHRRALMHPDGLTFGAARSGPYWCALVGFHPAAGFVGLAPTSGLVGTG